MKKVIMMMAVGMLAATSVAAQTVAESAEPADTLRAATVSTPYYGPNEEELPKSVKHTTTVRTLTAQSDATAAEVPEQTGCTAGQEKRCDKPCTCCCCNKQQGHCKSSASTAPSATTTVTGNGQERRTRVSSGPHDFRSLDGEELPHSVRRTSTVRTVDPNATPAEEVTEQQTRELTTTPDDRTSVSSQMAPPELPSGQKTSTRTVRTVTP